MVTDSYGKSRAEPGRSPWWAERMGKAELTGEEA